MFYYISIGSNINPEENFSQILTWLVKTFECVVVYPVIQTQPENLATKNVFLNTIAIFYSELSKDDIKLRFNQLEEKLGRDRSDLHRGHKDRTADLDIITCSQRYDVDVFGKCEETYIKKVITMSEPSVEISLENSQLGDRPSTIYLDRATGQIRIINNEINGLEDWLKTRLES